MIALNNKIIKQYLQYLQKSYKILLRRVNATTVLKIAFTRLSKKIILNFIKIVSKLKLKCYNISCKGVI